MRHAVAYQKRQPEGSVRDAWARHHSHYPGYLLARAPQHAERGCQSYGGRPELERSGVKVVSNVPWAIAQGSLAATPVLPFFAGLFRSTGGRARTDTVLSHHRILSPARLPIPPLRRGTATLYQCTKPFRPCGNARLTTGSMHTHNAGRKLSLRRRFKRSTNRERPYSSSNRTPTWPSR